MLIYRIIDNLDYSPEQIQELIASLPLWRRQQAMKFKHQQGRLECALSYKLLRSLLPLSPPHEEGRGADVYHFVYGEHGKPYLTRTDNTLNLPSPLQGKGVGGGDCYFNLSHCKKAVACIVSDEGEVGIDVECLGRYKLALAQYCMSNEELQQIASAPDPDAEFTLLWTRKEALLKCTGEGITDDMKTCLTSERARNIEIHSGLNKEKGYAWSTAFKP